MTDQLQDLTTWTERTYLSRLQLAKRLQLRGALWGAALVSSSVVSAVVSVALLVDDSIYGRKGAFVWSAAGIIILAASLVVSNADYAQRARLAFEAYRKFQRISVLVRDSNDQARGRRRRKREFAALNGSYQALLDETVNHSSADFAAAMQWRILPRGAAVADTATIRYVTLAVLTGHKMRRFASALVTGIPVVLVAISIAAIIPLVVWVADAH